MNNNLKLRYSRSDIQTLFRDSVVSAVCSTPAFKRLRSISFLGAIDKKPQFSSCRHNRFDHSIGVALLAQNYADALALTTRDRVAVVLAALLHDVGHAPLSHSLEPVFDAKFGLNHHVATANLLQGKVPLGKELAATIRQSGLAPERLIELISGTDDSDAGRIFSSPINVDTMEAIWRGGAYLGRRFTHPTEVLTAFVALDSAACGALESFWSDKNTFYQLMIYGQQGVEADHFARVWAKDSAVCLKEEDFYLSENEFFKERRPLHLDVIREECTLTVKVRKFTTNSQEKLTSYESLRKRFTVAKETKTVTLQGKKKINEGCQTTIW